MMKPTIFDNDQYRIYVPFRKSIELENRLIDAKIDYWIDLEMHYTSSDYKRFYFNKKDANVVEKLLKENEIQTTDDFKAPADYLHNRKIYFFAIMLAIVLFVVGFIILKAYQFLFQ
ncbi:bromodomain-containing protein [Chryseobacterium paridis]|uniref:Uncharacterized protein n=1 Tax=Chryseobacterium paridis TaxID=2800328 RepID=A0ABS1FRT3_9FLAO|nr:hypothetical protein [Chryseobacterium paridis]MBK1895136.1 hypothetical protein [Chryseobacterium paridis]